MVGQAEDRKPTDGHRADQADGEAHALGDAGPAPHFGRGTDAGQIQLVRTDGEARVGARGKAGDGHGFLDRVWARGASASSLGSS